MAEVLWYETVNRYGNPIGTKDLVLVQNIERLAQSRLGGHEITVIHLNGGDTLRSADTIETLAGRIEGAGVGA